MKGKTREGIFIFGAALALFAGLFWATFPRLRNSENQMQAKVLILGDSILGLTRDETGIPAQLERILDVPVFNGAFGGTCAARCDREYRLANARDSISLAGLAKAIATEDFGVQQTLRIRDSSTEHFSSTIDVLERLDFSSVELVVIMYGLNDFYSGVPVYNPEDPLDEYSFIGALRYSIQALRRENPDVRILLVTPTYSWYLFYQETCEEYDIGYGTMDDYVLAETALAEEMQVELLDVYHNVYPHEEWEDWERYTIDGFHPNEAGRELLAGLLSEYLLEDL